MQCAFPGCGTVFKINIQSGAEKIVYAFAGGFDGAAPAAGLIYHAGAFYGTTLEGVPDNRKRWKRGVALVDQSIGECLGKLYVEKYFPPQGKLRAEMLVRNLLEAYRQDIGELDWMDAETKQQALAKLAKITINQMISIAISGGGMVPPD